MKVLITWILPIIAGAVLIGALFWRKEGTLDEHGKQSMQIVVDAFASLPKEIDTARVRSAAEYRILIQMVRPLLKYNQNAQLEGDLAQSWKIEQDFKRYIFVIDLKAKWSDGSSILVSEVRDSINRQIRLNNATHFDFSSISKVEVDSNNRLIILLKEKNVHFLKSTAHPEFSVIKNSMEDIMTANSFAVTSGPYYLMNRNVNEINLGKNEFYENSKVKSPKTIKFKSSPFDQQIEDLIQNRVQFVVPSNNFTSQRHLEIIGNSGIKALIPHVGYTYWFSLNPKHDSMRDVSHRYWLTSELMKITYNFQEMYPFWEKADQLYLPDGFGRPKIEEIQRAWLSVKSLAKKPKFEYLNLVMSAKFPWTHLVKDHFQNLGFKVNVNFYSEAATFEELLKKGDYDAILVNNDFSDAHLVENLVVTFNKSRPLIRIDKNSHYYSLLEQALMLNDNEVEKSTEISKKIALDLISEGLIAPIAYNRKVFYYRDHLDVSSWSDLQSDLCFWKIGIN